MTAAVTADARATVRHLPTSASKVREVLALIRNKPVEEAERTLQLCERAAADPVFKLLESAIANAETSREIPAEELYVSACWADEGPTRRSGRPRARGRFGRIAKRSAHVTIALSRYSEEELDELREREAARGTGAGEERRRRAERVARSRAAQGEEVDDQADLADEADETEPAAEADEHAEARDTGTDSRAEGSDSDEVAGDEEASADVEASADSDDAGESAEASDGDDPEADTDSDPTDREDS